jgi:hypothetical protein
MNNKIENYSARDLLELIISNQVNIAQRVFRINDYFLEKYGKEFIDKIEHKDKTFLKLIDESEHLIQQLKSKK